MAKREAELVTRAQDESARTTEIMRREHEQKEEMAQQEKEEAIANVYKMAGKISATTFFKSQAEFFNLVMLKKVKDSRDYRERFGMTWEQFCEDVGINRRTADRQLEDLEPFRQEFLDTLSNFSGVTLNKIKYLGMSVENKMVNLSENAITYNGETIPIDAEHKEEIQDLLETLEENHKKQIDEMEVNLRTAKKVSADKEKVINNLSRDLKRMERTVDLSELSEEELDAINLLAQVQTDFMRGLSDIRKLIKPQEAPEIALRQLYYLLILISKMCMEERLALQDAYAQAEAVPWEIMEDEIPPPEVLADNTPLTRGMGKALKAKLDARAKK